MKILKDSEIKSLTTRATAYDAVVNAIVKNNEGLTPEEVTTDLIIDALTVDNNEIENLTSQLSISNKRVKELEAENAALKKLPAGETAPITSQGEASGSSDDLASFANNHAGDTASILERCKAEGII